MTDQAAREARLAEIAELVETHWPWGLQDDGRFLLAELAASRALVEQMREALSAVQHTRQSDNPPVTLWRECLQIADAALAAVPDRNRAHRSEARVRELEALVEQMREALEWLANGDAWEVGIRYQEDGRYRFNPHPDSVYATPWGYARGALEVGKSPTAAVPDRNEDARAGGAAALQAMREFDTVIEQDDGVWCDENGPAAGGAEGDTP